jgi:hypothetical protein
MGDSTLIKRLPKDVQELVASGAYNLYHALNGGGFIVVTKSGDNYAFSESGSYLGATTNFPDPNKYEQIYSINPADWMNQFKVSNG